MAGDVSRRLPRRSPMTMDRRGFLMTSGAWLTAGEAARAATVPLAEARAALAPSGRLRAAINYGNTVLAQKNEKTGALTGVSVVLARGLAQRLGVPIEIIEF